MLRPLSGGEEGQLCPGDLPDLWAGTEGADALLIGPGLGRSEGVGELVGELLGRFAGPVLVDADGLTTSPATPSGWQSGGAPPC